MSEQVRGPHVSRPAASATWTHDAAAAAWSDAPTADNPRAAVGTGEGE